MEKSLNYKTIRMSMMNRILTEYKDSNINKHSSVNQSQQISIGNKPWS